MTKVSVREIRETACRFWLNRQKGVRYSQLVRRIMEAKPEASEGAVHTVVYDLPSAYQKEWYVQFGAFML